MNQLWIYRRLYDRQHRCFYSQLETTLELSHGVLRVTFGDDDWLALQETVLTHPVSGEDLLFEQDPQLWLQQLPRIFGSDNYYAELKPAEAPLQ